MTTKKPTMVDVAKAAGVSLGTVSKVMNGHPGVGDTYKQRVAQAADDLGYAHNMIAAGLRRQSTHSVGVVLPDLRNTFFAEFVEMFEEAAAMAGYSVIIMTTGDNRQRAEDKLLAMVRRRVDGVVVIPALSSIEDPVASLGLSVPAVLVDRVDESTVTPSVATDSAEAAYDGAKYLISIGHRKVAMATNTDSHGNARDRVIGFKRAVAEHHDVDGEVIVTGTSVEQIRGSLRRILVQQSHTALFTASNPVTLGALKAINDCGLAIPGDLSLLAFDDFEWLTLVPPFISAIRQPIERISSEAWHKLFSEMEHYQAGIRHNRFPADLIVRQSTAPLMR